ncbi:DsrE family protein [bacterium]|nr:DsrE family protein [bacterium]
MSELLSGSKKVVVSVSAVNKDSIVEALRIAVGIAAGQNPLDIALLFSGDGVVNGLIDRYNEEYDKYYVAAQAHNVSIFIDEYCLNLRSLDDAESIRPGFQIVKREEILAMLGNADVHVRL